MKDDARSELRRYSIGALLCAVLTLIAFWSVVGMQLSRGTTLWVTGLAAVLQVGVQLRCFLNLGWNNRKREDIQLIAFSILLLSVMVGGTIWIMGSLAGRMM